MPEATATALSRGIEHELPPWAKTLLKRPLIEIRRGISFGNDPPEEDSSVIALTAPSGKNVDIRFRNSDKATADKPHFATAGLAIPRMPLKATDCPAYECTVYVQWTHPIDSSRDFGTDGADMYLLGNGDIMEIGVMAIGGEVQMFKEYWLWPDTQSKPAYFIVMEIADNGASGSEKGMMVMINNYCQGVMQNDTDFWMERWHAEDEKEWVKDSRSNTAATEDILPCLWATLEKRKLGDSVTLVGREWKVTEASESR